MPKKGEKTRKLRALSAGRGVKPPKAWFRKMHKQIMKGYPQRSMKSHMRIVGGIWAKMSTESKKRIVKKYQK